MFMQNMQNMQSMKAIHETLQQQQLQTMLNQQTSQVSGAPSITVSGTQDVKLKIPVKAEGSGGGGGGSKFNWPTQNTQTPPQQQEAALQQAAQQVQLNQLASLQVCKPSLLCRTTRSCFHTNALVPAATKGAGRVLHARPGR